MSKDIDVTFNDQVLFTVTESDEAILKYNIRSADLQEDVKRRLKYIYDHKIQQTIKHMEKDWMSTLEERYVDLPTDTQKRVDLIQGQQDYLDKDAREAAEQSNNN